MKKWLIALIVLALAMVPIAALGETAADEAPALPAVGDVVHGFEVIEVRDFPLVDATIVLFEHQRTGAGLVYIANEDTNRVFDLTFLTQAIDNTGLPHVFEHSTLDGSEKYPSKALFFNLSYQTYNTYMNAATYQVMTTYPIASLSEAQLLQFADYYTDSCLNPMVLDDESIYREEAWRYRMASADDDLTIEGTVYSEMLGATTLDRAASYNNKRTALPGSMVGNDSGGDPASIPDMTFESLVSYHELYYHPSNLVAYLYGQFDDYAAFLKLLDDAFAPFERREFNHEDPGYTPLTGPVEAEFAFPVEASSDTNNASTIYYSIVCPGLKDDEHEELIVNTLTDLLAADSSVLSQAMKRTLPTASFSCYIETEGPDDMVVFVASHVNRGDAQVFRDTVDEALRGVAENGFAQEMVDGVMASLSLSIRLTPESNEIGVDVIPSIAYSYATSGNPFSYLDYVDALANIDDWNQQGLYAKAVADWLVDNPLTAVTTTYPEAGLKEQRDAEEAARLAEVKAGMSEDELAAVIAASNAEAEEDAGTADMVAALQAVTVESLPEEIKTYELRDETGEDGIRRVDAVAGVEGIGKVVMFFDAAGLPQEDIHWFHLFASLLGELDTSAHTREELAVLMERYLYGAETRLSLMGDGLTYHPWLRLGWTAMDEDQAAAYDLMHEIVYDTQFDNAQYLLEAVQQMKASLKSGIISSPYNVLLYRGFGVTLPLYRYYSYYNHLEYYDFLVGVEQLLTEDPEAGAEKLRAIQDYFNNSTNAVAGFAGSEESIALNRPLADAYLASLGSAPIEPVDYDLPVPAAREGLIIDSAVQFNVMTANYEQLGMAEYDAGLDAVTTLVNDTFLMPLLRDQYGAYSIWHAAVNDAGLYAISYRDPNVAETFAVYDQLPELVGGLELDQQTLNGYILSSYTYYAQSSGELTGAVSALVNLLDGHDQDEALEYMRQLKAVTPENVAERVEMYENFIANGTRSTAGSASVINANADRFDVILNPFGSVDASQQELTDVAEGDEAYEAIRFMFENGYMGAFEDGSFGADLPATVGDLATALYVEIGGPSNAAEEAVETFAGYGIVWDDAQPDETISAETCDAILDTFAYAVGVEYPGGMTVDADPFTRADLARTLYDYINWIEAA